MSKYHSCVTTRPVKFKTCRRWNLPGDAHELTFSTFRRYALLSRDRTRIWVIEALAAARVRHDFAVLAYVIMPEHVHLVIGPRQPRYDVSTILKAIKFPVAWRARRFLEDAGSPWLARLTNQLPGGRRNFRFWQRGGGYDRNIQNYATLERMMEYIHANPVRRGLCATPGEWRWSSARWYEGARDGPLAMDDGEL